MRQRIQGLVKETSAQTPVAILSNLISGPLARETRSIEASQHIDPANLKRPPVLPRAQIHADRAGKGATHKAPWLSAGQRQTSCCSRPGRLRRQQYAPGMREAYGYRLVVHSKAT